MQYLLTAHHLQATLSTHLLWLLSIGSFAYLQNPGLGSPLWCHSMLIMMFFTCNATRLSHSPLTYYCMQQPVLSIPCMFICGDVKNLFWICKVSPKVTHWGVQGPCCSHMWTNSFSGQARVSTYLWLQSQLNKTWLHWFVFSCQQNADEPLHSNQHVPQLVLTCYKSQIVNSSYTAHE